MLVQAVLADGTRIAVRTAPTAGAAPGPGAAITLGLSPADTVVIADQ